MQTLRFPRPKDAPPRRKRAPIVSTADAPPCGVCEKQLSRYTCPACNLPYCSLACFRDPAHKDCSDNFSRQTLREEMQGAPEDGEGKGAEQRRMVEMLKRFEEQQRELEELEREMKDDDGPEDDEDDTEEGRARRKEREELEKRLEGVNLDALSPEDLLAYLSPEQQAAFQSTLQDPARVTRLVDEQFEADEPWWIVEEERKVLREMVEASKAAAKAQRANGEGEEEQENGEESEDEEEEDEPVRPLLVEPAKLPPLAKDAQGKPVVNQKLVFNIVAVLFAYAYTLRTFALTSFSSLPVKSTERATAIQVLSQLLPFLVERSTAAFDDADQATAYVVAREDKTTFTPPLVSMLLQDLASILRPTGISTISSASTNFLASHSLATALSALSDLHHLFSTALATSAPSAAAASPSSSGPTVSRPLIARPSTTSPLTKQQRQQCTLASAKLLFYCAVLAADPNAPNLCRVVAEQTDAEAERREKERERDEAAVARQRDQLRREKEGRADKAQVREEEQSAGPKIVEL
ncbi:hypothetical protein JCM10207_008797 [Rhodosporidiobolus poonsookiae]